MKFREMTKEQLKEESFIDLGYAILEEKHESLTLQELLNEIQALNGFTNAQMKERMLQYYTDMNIDGRFFDGNIHVGIQGLGFCFCSIIEYR